MRNRIESVRLDAEMETYLLDGGRVNGKAAVAEEALRDGRSRGLGSRRRILASRQQACDREVGDVLWALAGGRREFAHGCARSTLDVERRVLGSGLAGRAALRPLPGRCSWAGVGAADVEARGRRGPS